MARKTFFSFHYKPDCSRAAQVRNMGMVEGSIPVSDNDWETVTKGGNAEIERWIADQLHGKSCAIVLVGAETAGRKWVTYEIVESWNRKMGVLGVRIHRLKDLNEKQATAGGNPFDYVTLEKGTKELSAVVKLYDPPYLDSKEVYAYIKKNLAAWVDKAIEIRDNYGK